MDIEIHDVITVTDTEQTWVICDLCGEPYRHEPGGGITVPEECEVCSNSLALNDAQTGFWFSDADESEIHGPFESQEQAKARALSRMFK